MAPLTSIIEIARPQGEVFSYVTDPATFAEWQAGVVGGSMEAGKPVAVGSKCTTTRRMGGAEREATSELTKLDPPTSWAVRGIDGPIQAIVNEPLNEGVKSRVTIDRVRIREARYRQAARATRRPPPGTQRNAREPPPAQATPRVEPTSGPEYITAAEPRHPPTDNTKGSQ